MVVLYTAHLCIGSIERDCMCVRASTSEQCSNGQDSNRFGWLKSSPLLCFFFWIGIAHTKNIVWYTPTITIKCVNIDDISSKHSHFMRAFFSLSPALLFLSLASHINSQHRLVKRYGALYVCCVYCYEEPSRIIDRIGIYK